MEGTTQRPDVYTREERCRKFGIDVGDELEWRGWYVSVFSLQHILIHKSPFRLFVSCDQGTRRRLSEEDHRSQCDL
jgi:hypothetical protein